MQTLSIFSYPYLAMSYQEYLTSDHWKEIRNKTLNNPYYGRPNECFVCSSPFGLVIHHLTYIRKGHELDEDLVILCDTCHKRVHLDENGKIQSKNIWLPVFILKKEALQVKNGTNVSRSKLRRYVSKRNEARKRAIELIKKSRKKKHTKKELLFKKLSAIAYYQMSKRS